MILKELFGAQKELDERIIEEHNLQGKDEFDKKIVAFIVELSELANEIRFFKFWSNKKPSDTEIILDEYADCLHFLLSIGNELGEICGEEIQVHDYRNDLNYKGFTEDFIEIIRSICELQLIKEKFICDTSSHQRKIRIANCVDSYIQVFERFLMLGYKIGFSWKDIEMGYYTKNRINYQRQDNGY